jgi:hypothetical protein
MRTLLSILFVLIPLHPAMAEEINNSSEDFILASSPPQKVYSRYQTDFSFHHDRGFYLAAALGPEWNHSFNNPKAQGIRFGSKFNVGWFVANGVALFGSAWGNFLEAATLIAGGPGVAFLFDSTNMSIDISFGVGRVFNVIKREDINEFAETILAANLSIGKYWWLSSKTSLGVSLLSGVHGFTIAEGKLSSIGWNVGLGLAFLFG